MYNVFFFFFLFFEVRALYTCGVSQKCKKIAKEYKSIPAIKRLQEYIQIDTTHPENSEYAAEFWRRQAEELDLPFAIHRPSGLPICVITLRGRRPELPSILLNSHSDVVPVDADLWKYPPFSGHIDSQGNLYGRGTQDCKSNGILYLEAIRKILQSNITLERTVHVTVVPDEETGGLRGMMPFIKTKKFRNLNVGFIIDEGLASGNNDLYAFYLDKRPWQLQLDIRGEGGHGSQLISGGAVDQLDKLLNLTIEYRAQQMRLKNANAPLDFGTYTTLNVNVVQGGIATNVVPARVFVVLDIRLGVDVNPTEFHSMIDTWVSKLNSNTTYKFIRKIDSSEPTVIDDSNPYWVTVRETLNNIGQKIVPIVSPGTTDMLPIRALGIPAIGFTTIKNTKVRIHNIDEYISLDNFIEGIDVFVALIKNLGNLPDIRK